MKTKLLRSLMTAVCLFFFIAEAKGFQSNETLNETPSKDNKRVSFILQDSLIPLDCEAPIDPSWLKRAKKGVVTGKILEEPTVRVAYLIPSNRTPQEKGVDALQFIISAGRDFFKDHMAYNGLDPKTFRYETEADGETPLIHVVNIPETDEQIRDEDQFKAWTNTINAARNAGLSIWQSGEIWLIVAETHFQRPDGSMSAEIALGGGSGHADDPGVAILGSTKLTSIAKGGITDNEAYHGLIIPEIGPYPLRQNVSFPWFEGSTLSSIVSSTVGSFIHELSHAMGLFHHDIRNDRNFHGNLMGHGLRGIRGHLYPNRYPDDYTRLAFTSAQALNSSHYFNAGKQRNQVDNVSFSLGSNTPQEGNLAFNVSASDADGLSLLQLFGLPDYSVEHVLSGNHFEGQIQLPYFELGTQTNFILKVYDRQGNKTESNINVNPQSGNRAPWPFMRFSPPIGEAGETFVLDAGGSRDPDGNSPLTFEWDFDNDGVFDTEPNQNALTTKNFSGGNHLIRLKVTEPSGAFTISTPMALHVTGDPPPQTEVSFTLIDADTDEVIPGFDPIPEGAQINLAAMPAHLGIRANVLAHYESVRFDYDGEASFRVENLPPYALYGDIEGDYNPGTFSRGAHTLAAIPFAQDGAHGTQGIKGILHFSVIDKLDTFTLVDADTDEDLFTIKRGMIINIFTIFNKNLNIRTSHDKPRDDLKVHFKLSGPINRTWTEHVFPYALFGDINGDYNGENFPIGDYDLTAFFSQKEAPFNFESPDIVIHFTIEPAIISSLIFRSETFMSPFVQIENGMTYFPTQGSFAGNASVAAITSLPAGGSVVFEISGPINHKQIENLNPYSLFGDIDGDFNAREFPDGHYTLTATPYAEPDGKGPAGIPLTVSFTIDLPEAWLTSLIRLVDVNNLLEEYDLFDDRDGNIIDIKEIPTNNASIYVDYECDFDFGACPGSVYMLLEGPVTISRIENVKPYTLFGDIDRVLNGGDLPLGNYTITITPYWEDNALGEPAGPTVVRDFQIIDSGSTFLKTALYPNPARTTAHVQMEEGTSGFKTMIFNLVGNKVKELSMTFSSEQAIDVSELPPGIYIIQIQTEKSVETKKLVVQ